MSSARFKRIPSKGIFLPNANAQGFALFKVHAGDLVVYREPHTDGSATHRLARVLDLVTHDHEGKEYRAPSIGTRTKAAPLLRVLAFDVFLNHGYERWIDRADVIECRAPSAEHARFASWALAGVLPQASTVIAASKHGSLNDRYFDRCRDEQGNLPEDWRERSDRSWGEGGIMKLDAFTRAFFTCALWSSTDESRDDGGDPLDENYTIDDIAPICLKALAHECEQWQEANRDALEACYAWSETGKLPLCAERAGHDFWLNRNGHGCGFWDGDWPEPWATMLDEAAEKAGECGAYLGDDGKIWFFGYETGARS